MTFGMLSYEIPFATYPDTYNKQPLTFAALAAQNTTSRCICIRSVDSMTFVTNSKLSF